MKIISPVSNIPTYYAFKKENLSFKSTRYDFFEKTQQNKNPYGKEISDETYNKVKQMVISTILTENPHESMALVENNDIIKFIEGEDKKIILDFETKYLLHDPERKIHVIHSHPEEISKKTLPISLSDCDCLINQNGAVSACAVDKNGKYSLLKKTDTLQSDLLKKFEAEYHDSFIKAFDDHPEYKTIYEELLKQFRNFVAFDEDDFEYINIITIGLNYYKEMAAGFDKTPEIIHNFWQKHAQEIGLLYLTDFQF